MYLVFVGRYLRTLETNDGNSLETWERQRGTPHRGLVKDLPSVTGDLPVKTRDEIHSETYVRGCHITVGSSLFTSECLSSVITCGLFVSTPFFVKN